MLRLSACKFIDQRHLLILEGASSNGKTWIACALGISACRKFKRVRYISDAGIINGIKTFRKPDLPIVDEWLIRCLTQRESYDLLEIIEVRIHRGSLILCTQYAPKG